MSSQPTGSFPLRRLNRLQQLTLTTWRFGAARLDHLLAPDAILEHAAVHAVLGALRDVDDPVGLFSRHNGAHPEVSLVLSLIRGTAHEDLVYDILEAGFLARWNELVADGLGPEELPPLRREEVRQFRRRDQ